VPADAKYRYDRTALSFAADRGQADIVALLLERGANVNATDTFYKATPLVWAAENQHVEVVRMLLARGATGAGDVLGTGVEKQNADLVQAALATTKLTADDLAYAVEQADKKGLADIAARLRKAGAVPPASADFKVDPDALARYAGTYKESAGAGQSVTLSVADGALLASFFGGPPRKLGAFDARNFRVLEAQGIVRLSLKMDGERVTGVTLLDSDGERSFQRVEAPRP
jgi:ankyrin repeat protein